MTVSMTFNHSIAAIQDCMKALGIHKAEQLTHEVAAKLINLKTHASGNINAIFNSNWHSGDGPFLEFDEAIRSFGISHSCFTPKWQTFVYDSDKKELIVKDKNYQFLLRFS